MATPYPAMWSSVRHLINLSLKKPKSFPVASGNLNSIMSVIKSFEKHPSIVKIKAKVLDTTFHFRKTSYNEVKKIISHLSIEKSLPTRRYSH